MEKLKRIFLARTRVLPYNEYVLSLSRGKESVDTDTVLKSECR